MHYHTPDLVAPAALAVRASAANARLDLDFVVVDNGSTPEARATLESLQGVRLLDLGRNLGYGGGANFGFERSDSELLVVMNPDVIVDSHCFSALHESIKAGAGCAGPCFTWDKGGSLLMPPGDCRTFGAEIGRAAAGWNSRLESRVRRSWRAHARRHWQAGSSLRSESLSGALLMFRRDAWQKVGPFDEDYKLYFEETDWLRRAVRAGVETRYLRNARAVHYYDQSASGEPRSGDWFQESAARFREVAYGRTGSWVLAQAERRVAKPGREALASGLIHAAPSSAPVWLELSPELRGFPAVGCYFEGGVPAEWSLPEDVRERHPDLSLYGRLVSPRGEELKVFRIDPAGKRS